MIATEIQLRGRWFQALINTLGMNNGKINEFTSRPTLIKEIPIQELLSFLSECNIELRGTYEGQMFFPSGREGTL